MSDRVDVAIIGAGIIGCAIAFELSKRGLSTLNVDRLPAAGYGPTSNSCSIVRAHYSSLESVTMAHEAFSHWENWAGYLETEDESGFARYHQTGTVLLKTDDQRHSIVLEHFRAVGVEHEEWSCKELEQNVPYLNTGRFWPPKKPTDPDFWTDPATKLEGAIFTPRSGYVNDPQLASHNLQRAAEAKGARFRFGCNVTGIDVGSDRVHGVVLDGAERIPASIVINVAGPHSDLVNQMAGAHQDMKIRTRSLRHEVHIVDAPDGVDFERDGMHISDADTGIYFRPETGNRILVGSEDPECDERTWVDDPDAYDRGVTEQQWEAQVYRLARRIKNLGIPNRRQGLVDLYDVADDWVPIYDRSAIRGYYMAVGTSGNQFKNASVVGGAIAELVDRCESGHDHDADPVQVKLPVTGDTLDLGFYSRLREPSPNSSYSVNG